MMRARNTVSQRPVTVSKTSNSNNTTFVKSKEGNTDIYKDSDDDVICELEHLRKLFIGGLSPNTTEESLKAFYEQWGKVVDVVVMRDTTSNRSRGFGFITYTKAHMVDSAQEARPHIIDGKTVQAKRALSKPERDTREPNISANKVFVGGLKDNHDEKCLTDYFSKFGNVVSVKILADKITGKPRGFAYIEFDDYDSVDKAISQKFNSINNVVVDVKRSVYNREKRNAPENANKSDNSNLQGPPVPSNNQSNKAGMPPYAPPMNGGPTPPNYNYWNQGPPQPPPQPYYGGYQQPPAQSPWNYPQAPPNGWNAGPPPQGPSLPVAGNWQPQNQWGLPPAAPSNWNATQHVAPNGPPGGNDPQSGAPQVPSANFGTGYQQNYGGSPTKNSTINSNRMNPYGVPPHGGYGNHYNNLQTGPGYNNYNSPPANGPPGFNFNAQTPSTGGNVGPGPEPVPSVPNGNRRY